MRGYLGGRATVEIAAQRDNGSTGLRKTRGRRERGNVRFAEQ